MQIQGPLASPRHRKLLKWTVVNDSRSSIFKENVELRILYDDNEFSISDSVLGNNMQYGFGPVLISGAIMSNCGIVVAHFYHLFSFPAVFTSLTFLKILPYLHKRYSVTVVKNQRTASVGHSHLSMNWFNQIAFPIHTQLRGSFYLFCSCRIDGRRELELMLRLRGHIAWAGFQ